MLCLCMQIDETIINTELLQEYWSNITGVTPCNNIPLKFIIQGWCMSFCKQLSSLSSYRRRNLLSTTYSFLKLFTLFLMGG
jgi:hypothetical protein